MLDDARNCNGGNVLSVLGSWIYVGVQPKTYLNRKQHQRNNGNQIKQRNHSARSDDKLQSSEVKVVAPYREQPRVRALLGFEESQSCGRAHESCDRDDQGEDEESEEWEV